MRLEMIDLHMSILLEMSGTDPVEGPGFIFKTSTVLFI
jgi:hypothetical protein